MVEFGRIFRLLRVVPGQPSRGACLHVGGASGDRQEIGEGVHAIEPTGVDEAVEQNEKRERKKGTGERKKGTGVNYGQRLTP